MSMRYTFSSLFRDSIPLGESGGNPDVGCIARVVVPRIQRPYAQGRMDEESVTVRKKFLSSIFAVLRGESKSLDLNFIYGKVHPVKGHNNLSKYEMELLDGQQRFTTLFLLHWYLFVREKLFKEEGAEDLLKGLQSFEYETRKTSSDFCRMLGGLANPDAEFAFNDKTPRVAIQSSLRYVHAFETDPTVGAMLTMLDAIDEFYRALPKDIVENKVWGRLENISFSVLSLTEYKLSEELYIKMNARGLPLTPFECFKSDFLDLCHDMRLVDIESGNPMSTKSERAVTYKQFFATRLDVKWCDVFWSPKNPAAFSRSYMLFFSRYFAVRFMLENLGGVRGQAGWRNKDIDLQVLFYKHEKDREHYHGIGPYKTLVESELGQKIGYFRDITVILDLLKNRRRDLIDAMIAPWDRVAETNYSKRRYARQGVVDGYWGEEPLTQPQLVMLSGVISFLHYFPQCPRDIFLAWMNSVHCVVENTDISDIAYMANVSKNLEEIVCEIAKTKPITVLDFYRGLSHVTIEATAIIDEVRKAKRIAEDSDAAATWISLFDEVACHPFLKGVIGFYYDEKMTIDDFTRQVALVSKMFGKDGISGDYRGGEYLLLRAIMSQITNWSELSNVRVTEDHDSKKRLKNLLCSNTNKELQSKIRRLFVERLFPVAKDGAVGEFSREKINESLKAAIVEAPKICTDSDWATCEALRALRECVGFYRWAIERNTKGPVRIYWNIRQIQARAENQRTYVMMSVLRPALELAHEFEMRKVPVRSYTTAAEYVGYDAALDLFVGGEVVLEKHLEKFQGVMIVVRITADNLKDTPIELSVKWNASATNAEIASKAIEALRKLSKSSDIEMQDENTVGEEKIVCINRWSFAPNKDDSLSLEDLRVILTSVV
ncbi:MAG: DUF262 domain-containing protein [bacterium]|nr:DUF262 domain-containing protein [bacterium]